MLVKPAQPLPGKFKIGARSCSSEGAPQWLELAFCFLLSASLLSFQFSPSWQDMHELDQAIGAKASQTENQITGLLMSDWARSETNQ
jgi:hypothetical protein